MSLQKVEVGRPGAVASSFHQDSEEEEWWEDTFSEDNDEITLDALFRETRQAAGRSWGICDMIGEPLKRSGIPVGLAVLNRSLFLSEPLL
jgi:hypothetical protein